MPGCDRFFTALAGAKGLSIRQRTAGTSGKIPHAGVEFSSGRLGHLWAFCNDVAMANPGKAVILLGSDRAQMEGDDAEAARLTLSQHLNVKVIVDDNNVTIPGRPQEYLPGYDLSRTLSGYGLTTETTMGEDIEALYVDLCRMFRDDNPHALIVKRPMAPGIEGCRAPPKAMMP